MKVSLFLMLFALGSSVAFSQTAPTVQGSATEAEKLSEQQRLEAEATSAEAIAVQSESHLGTAIINLEKFEQSGDDTNTLAFAHKKLELKAALAHADFSAAQSRATAMKKRFAASQKASKTIDGSRHDTKVQFQNQDTISENDIAKANEEALRKDKIASEATAELSEAQAKEAAMLAEEESRKARMRETVLSPSVRAAMEIQALAEKVKADVEAEARANKEREALLAKEIAAQKSEEEEAIMRKAKANLNAIEEAFKKARQLAEIKREADAKLEQEALEKAQAKERALNAEKAAHKTEELVVTKKILTLEEALQQAMDQQDAIQTEKNESKKPQVKKPAEKAVDSGELFSLIRDEPIKESAGNEVSVANK